MSNAEHPENGGMAYIGMGANLGDRLVTLNQAVERITTLGLVRSVSSVYETDPVGFPDQPAFLNAAIGLQTLLAPGELMTALLQIERELGRVRTFPNAPRTIDLDLLLYSNTVIDTADVAVPHPRLHERSFVLVPLADIAPNVVHPLLGISIRGLRTRLGHASGVRQIAGSLMSDSADAQ